ncbi:kelch 18, partial [Paramuricea clavata]
MSWNSSRVHPCFMRKEMDVVQTDVKEVQNDTREVEDEVKQMKLTQEEFIRNLMDQVARQNDVVDDLCHRMNNMKAEMEWNAKEASERCDLFTGRQKIFVCGGGDSKTNFNSVESYSWPENSWTVEPAMKEARSDPSAFVHERQIYVSGGWTGTQRTDSIESMNVKPYHHCLLLSLVWLVLVIK